MTTQTDLTDQIRAASAGCAAYGLMAHGFRYPDERWRAVLTDPDRWRDWPEELPESHRAAHEPLLALREAVERLKEPVGLAPCQEQFAFLFGHSVRGKCPPYELEFGQGEVIQRASDLADISGFYAAFGMAVTGEVSERPDHLSVQAEFLAVICAKALCGLENGDEELVAISQHAQVEFLKAHLGRWLPGLTRRVRESVDTGFYRALANFADAWVTCDCKRCGISVGSPYLPLRPIDPVQETTQSCGLPSECVAKASEALIPLNIAVGGDG